MSSIEQPDMNEMKKKFESKPESEQQEILKEDQLKAKSVDTQLEKDKNLTDVNSVIYQLDKIWRTDHYTEEKDIFSDKDIEQKTHRIENMPSILTDSIKQFIAHFEESNFNTGVDHNLYQEFCMEDITKEDIDYIVQRFTTQFKTKLIDLKDGSKRIDIIPEGSRIKTQNDNITIDRLSIVFDKPRSDEDKYVILLECARR